jgi:phage terminase large subunit
VFTGLSTLTASQIKSFEGIDICWVEEAATVTKRSWEILIKTIRKAGSEIWVTFNPDLDTDDTWVRFVENTPPNCHVEEMSFDTNPWRSEEFEKDRLHMLDMIAQGKEEQETYDNEYLGQPKTAVDGAIYAKQTLKVKEDNRLTHVPHDPVLFTHLIWDLGYSDNMVIGFVQRAGSSVRFIDYIEDSHRTYDSYVSQIRQMAEKNGYRIALDGRTGGKAWLPHDGKAKRPEVGKSPIELLNELGLKTDEEGVPDIGIKGRIEAGRQMFARCVFDKEKCTPLFNRLRRYARKINPEGHAVTIKKDGNDHAGDMYIYS